MTKSQVLAQSLQESQQLERKLKRLSSTLARWQLTLRKHQSIRLGVGLTFFASLVPGSLSHAPKLEWVYPLPFLIAFVVLVFRTQRIAGFVRRLQRWEEFLKRQHHRCLGQPSGRTFAAALRQANDLSLVRDIGLLGSHSLWTLVDETISDGGRQRLLHWMTSPSLDKAELRKRQHLIQQLRGETWFYTRLVVDTPTAELNISTVQIQEFLRTPAVDAGFNRLLALNLLVWFGTLAGAVISDIVHSPLPRWVLVIFPVVSLFSLRAGGGAFRAGVGLAHHLAALTPLFRAIEKRARRRETLLRVCPTIVETSPSSSARRLDFIMNFVGTQTNPILHFVLNAFLPWTVVAVYFFERVRIKISKNFPLCLAELEEFEVLGSLLLFAHYQTRTYPEFSDAGSTLRCTALFHPLLDRAKAVPNDFSFSGGKSLGLLTGSNMSGKSTFLRTLGINQVLANMGAPVFADSMTTAPMKIETCIEVTDSLRDGYSYFYAEVRKLRHILSVAATGTPTLFLIDEIFRGTNNRERQLGSRAVIRTLAREKSAVGFISTHDLELTALEQTSPSVINLHFREDLDASGAMHFHYHLNHGPSPTTNALIIMKAEGIPIEE